MKRKICVTLSSEVLKDIDRLAGKKFSRSALIERVLRSCIGSRTHTEIQLRDVERINKAAKRLNSEAADVLEYQVIRS